ncbi:MAG: hypothetical protein JWP63_5494 [Candidatus Solibacter sp.]|jgi:hypothetical protein|nr:hypothetical protein [Candidatus Solibacter sp.]
MTSTENKNNQSTSTGFDAPDHETKIWLGIAVGVAVGIGIAISRRKRSRWDTARSLTSRVTERSGELSEVALELAGRVRNIFEESVKVVEGATNLWASGRKLVGY